MGRYNKDGQTIWHSMEPHFINPKEFIDAKLQEYHTDALTIANTIHTPLLTKADKESLALEGLYEAAGLYDPARVGKRGVPMKFSSWLMLRIRHILLREIRFLKIRGRCASRDEVSIENEKCPMCGSETIVKFGEFGDFLSCSGYPVCTFNKPLREPVTETVTKKYLRDVTETETTHEINDEGDKKTIFDSYIPVEPKAPFDLEEVLASLNQSKRPLNPTQFKILELFLSGDMSGAEIAREIGVTRQMVNLHLKKIRQKIRQGLKKTNPDFDLRRYKNG